MSLSSTATLKAQISAQLGSEKSELYLTTLRDFITGKISRTEFEDIERTCLDTPHLVQLHNSLIVSLFDPRSHKRPLTPQPEVSKTAPPRKRRRIFPYQGEDTPDSELTQRSTRLKRWAITLGKRERERIRSLQTLPSPLESLNLDEMSNERGIVPLSERGDPPGSRLPIHLAAVSRAPTLQHVADRMNLICAQNNLGAPPRTVPSLMMLACEIKLKQLIARAIALTSSSEFITSIPPTQQGQGRKEHTILDVAAFTSLFTLYPSCLPNGSSYATRLAWTGDRENAEEVADANIALLKDREARDPRWQLLALLGERSTVKEAMRDVN